MKRDVFFQRTIKLFGLLIFVTLFMVCAVLILLNFYFPFITNIEILTYIVLLILVMSLPFGGIAMYLYRLNRAIYALNFGNTLIEPVNSIFNALTNDLNLRRKVLTDDLKLLSQQSSGEKERLKQLKHQLEEWDEINQILSSKEEEFKNTLEESYEFIWITDGSGKIEFANENFCRSLGYEVNEILGVRLSKIMSDFDSSQCDPVEILSKRNFDDLGVRLVCKDGTEGPKVSVRTSRTNEESGMMIYFVACDMTNESQSISEYYYKDRELFSIFEINKIMTASVNDMDIVLQSITDKVNSLINIYFTGIRTLRGGKLIISANAGYVKESILTSSYDCDNTHMGLALKENRIIKISGEKDFLIQDDPHIKSVLSIVNHIILLPLRNMNNLYGVMIIGTHHELDDEKMRLLKYMTESASIVYEKALIYDRLRDNYFKTISALANALEEKLGSSTGHMIRVSQLAGTIGKKLYLNDHEIEELKIAGLLHDMGKIGIKDDLLKLGTSNNVDGELEDSLLHSHPAIGKRILSQIGLSDFILDAIHFHHKCFDLSGYPKEVQLKEQPLSAQIIQIANDFDNLIFDHDSDTKAIEYAINELRKKSGTHYGEEVVEAMEEIYISNKDTLEALILMGA